MSEKELLEVETSETPDNIIKFEEVSSDEVEPTLEEFVTSMLSDDSLTIDEKLKHLTESSEKLAKKIISEPYYLDLGSIKIGQGSKYITDVLTFVKNKLRWKGTDFVYVENIHRELENLKKTYQEGAPIPLTGATVSAFYQLQMGSGGEGYKEVKQKKYIVEPFLVPYGQCVQDNETYKGWGEDYQNLLAEKDNEVREKFEAEQLLKEPVEKETPIIDVPRTMDDISRILVDINGVFEDIKNQIKNTEVTVKS